MPLADKEDLIAFRQKMLTEGAAGFAAGPWGTWDESEILPASTVAKNIDYTLASNDHQTRQFNSRDNTPMRTTQRSGGRLATALMMFSLVAILVGTAGVYLSNIPDVHLASIQNDPARQPDLPVETDGAPLPAGDPRTGSLTDGNPLAAGGQPPAPAATGTLIRDSGTHTLALALPDAAQATATAAGGALPDLMPDNGDRFSPAREHAPAATAISPDTLPATAAGVDPRRTNTGIVLRNNTGASPLIPISATVPVPKQDDSPPGQADPVTAVQSMPAQANPGAADVQAAPAQAIPGAAEIQAAPAQAETGAVLKAPPAQQAATADKSARPRTGRWSVVLGSYSSKKVAHRMLAGFRNQGIAAELKTVTIDGATMHRVRVPGYRTKQAALTGAGDLNGQPGIDGAWITKR